MKKSKECIEEQGYATPPVATPVETSESEDVVPLKVRIEEIFLKRKAGQILRSQKKVLKRPRNKAFLDLEVEDIVPEPSTVRKAKKKMTKKANKKVKRKTVEPSTPSQEKNFLNEECRKSWKTINIMIEESF